jgi:hypothetical protein
MAFFTNHKNPDLIGVYDDELMVSHFLPNNNGKIIGRDSLENTHHSGGIPQFHPTLPKVIKNTSGHIYINGTFKVEFKWAAGEVTEQDMDDYIDLLSQYNVPIGFFDVTKDVANNTLVVSMTDPAPSIPEWSDYLVPWLPSAPKATLTNTSNDSEFLCIARLNNTFSDYTFSQRTIESGSTLSVDRPTCSVCYIIFTKDVSVNGKTLAKNKAYKLTSESLQVTNAGSNRALVLRYYRN